MQSAHASKIAKNKKRRVKREHVWDEKNRERVRWGCYIVIFGHSRKHRTVKLFVWNFIFHHLFIEDGKEMGIRVRRQVGIVCKNVNKSIKYAIKGIGIMKVRDLLFWRTHAEDISSTKKVLRETNLYQSSSHCQKHSSLSSGWCPLLNEPWGFAIGGFAIGTLRLTLICRIGDRRDGCWQQHHQV